MSLAQEAAVALRRALRHSVQRDGPAGPIFFHPLLNLCFRLASPARISLTGGELYLMTMHAGALFQLLGHSGRERPSKLKYRDSIRKSFARDPFIDSQGFEMRRTGRREPQRTAVNSPG
jgi:hypothetical protein